MVTRQDKLREYISIILTEDDGYDFGGAGLELAIGGGGYGYLDPGRGWFSSFVQPFTDVAKVVLAGVVDMSNRSVGLIKQVAYSIGMLFKPGIETEIKKIQRQTERNTKRIIEKYSDVFKRVNESFFHDDFAVVAFLLNPGVYFMSKFARTGASAAQLRKVFAQKIDYDFSARKQKAYKTTEKSLQNLYQAISQNYQFDENVDHFLTEDNKKDVAKIINSPLAKAMRVDAQELLAQRAAAFLPMLKMINKFAKVKTLDELTKLIGRRIDVKRFGINVNAKGVDGRIILLARAEYAKIVSSVLTTEISKLGQVIGGEAPVVKQLLKMKKMADAVGQVI